MPPTSFQILRLTSLANLSKAPSPGDQGCGQRLGDKGALRGPEIGGTVPSLKQLGGGYFHGVGHPGGNRRSWAPRSSSRNRHEAWVQVRTQDTRPWMRGNVRGVVTCWWGRHVPGTPSGAGGGLARGRVAITCRGSWHRVCPVRWHLLGLMAASPFSRSAGPGASGPWGLSLGLLLLLPLLLTSGEAAPSQPPRVRPPASLPSAPYPPPAPLRSPLPPTPAPPPSTDPLRMASSLAAWDPVPPPRPHVPCRPLSPPRMSPDSCPPRPGLLPQAPPPLPPPGDQQCGGPPIFSRCTATSARVHVGGCRG